MQDCTTIIGILRMLDDSFTYDIIRQRYGCGNSVITGIRKK